MDDVLVVNDAARLIGIMERKKVLIKKGDLIGITSIFSVHFTDNKSSCSIFILILLFISNLKLLFTSIIPAH